MVAKIFRWIAFGVLASVMPVAISILINVIIGYSIEFSKNLPDLLLVSFGVAAAALSYEVDPDQKISQWFRLISATFSVISMFFCLVLYFSFFNVQNEITYGFSIPESGMNMMILIAIITLAVNTLFGIVIEIWSHVKKFRAKNRCIISKP